MDVPGFEDVEETMNGNGENVIIGSPVFFSLKPSASGFAICG